MSVAYAAYKNQVVADGIDYIDDNYNDYESWDDMYDAMFSSDYVCGNASYNGYPSIRPANDVIMEFLLDEFRYVMEDYDMQAEELNAYFFGKGERGIVWIDSVIRCWMLDQVVDELEEHYDELASEE